MIILTPSQAIEVLKKPSTFASFRTCTNQTVFNKGKGDKSMVAVLGIDPDKILKFSSFTALCGTKVDYQTLVQNRELKTVEGIEAPTFIAEDRKWGTRVDGVEVVNGDKRYITLFFVANNVPKVVYTYKGEAIDVNDSKFDSWRKPAKVEGAKQAEHGVDNPVVYRDFGLESILEFTVDKEVHLIQA